MKVVVEKSDWAIMIEMLKQAGIKFEEHPNGGTARDNRTGDVVMSTCLELDAKSTGTPDGLEIAFSEEGQLLYIGSS